MEKMLKFIENYIAGVELECEGLLQQEGLMYKVSIDFSDIDRNLELTLREKNVPNPNRVRFSFNIQDVTEIECYDLLPTSLLLYLERKFKASFLPK